MTLVSIRTRLSVRLRLGGRTNRKVIRVSMRVNLVTLDLFRVLMSWRTCPLVIMIMRFGNRVLRLNGSRNRLSLRFRWRLIRVLPPVIRRKTCLTLVRSRCWKNGRLRRRFGRLVWLRRVRRRRIVMTVRRKSRVVPRILLSTMDRVLVPPLLKSLRIGTMVTRWRKWVVMPLGLTRRRIRKTPSF